MPQARNDVLHAAKTHDEVAVSSDIQPRNAYLTAGIRREEFPVAVNVAIPIQSAAKARAREFVHIEIYVRFAKPWRQRRGVHLAVKEAASPRHHSNIDACRPGAVAARSVTGSGIQQAANAATHVALEFRLGGARRLKVQLIEDSVVSLRHHVGGPHRKSGPKRHAQSDHGTEAIGAQ